MASLFAFALTTVATVTGPMTGDNYSDMTMWGGQCQYDIQQSPIVLDMSSISVGEQYLDSTQSHSILHYKTFVIESTEDVIRTYLQTNSPTSFQMEYVDEYGVGTVYELKAVMVHLGGSEHLIKDDTTDYYASYEVVMQSDEGYLLTIHIPVVIDEDGPSDRGFDFPTTCDDGTTLDSTWCGGDLILGGDSVSAEDQAENMAELLNFEHLVSTELAGGHFLFGPEGEEYWALYNGTLTEPDCAEARVLVYTGTSPATIKSAWKGADIVQAAFENSELVDGGNVRVVQPTLDDTVIELIQEVPRPETATTSTPESTDAPESTVVSTTDGGLSTTDEGLSTTDEGLSTTDEGLSTTDEGLSTTDEGLSTTDEGLSTTDDYFYDGSLSSFSFGVAIFVGLLF